MERNVHSDTYYDFRNEQKMLLILGGYKIFDRTPLRRGLNIIYSAVGRVLLASTLVMSMLTVAKTLKQKAIMGQALFTMGSVMCASISIIDNHVNGKELEEAAQSLRDGVFRYDDDLEEEYARLKKSNVSRLKNLVRVLTRLYMSSVFVYVVLFPVFNFLITEVGEDEQIVNVYLPLQLYYPFDTRNSYVFCLTFAANGLTLLFTYAAFNCYVEVVMSSSLQLTAEYEVLNFSIRNIKRRAINKLAREYFMRRNETDELYSSEFKKSMVHCLKQNIRHHHAILRLYRNFSTYLEVGAATAVVAVSGLIAAAIVIVLEDPKRYIILTATLIATVMTYYPNCWAGELLTTTSSETLNSLLFTPWVDCDKEFKMDLKIFIQNTVQPCVLRTIGLKISVSLETFAEVMSAGYKLLNVIR
nr:olfactory receptor 28 [Tropidothorax elegans]